MKLKINVASAVTKKVNSMREFIVVTKTPDEVKVDNE